jgi:hypothetical protein
MRGPRFEEPRANLSFFGAPTMKSITTAMTWELLASGRWPLAATGVGMVAIPLLVMTSLFSVARLDAQDATLHTLHLLFMQTNIVGGVVTLLGLAYQSTRPLFPQPAASSTLAGGRLIPAAALLAVQVILWSVAINAACRLNWPVWEPAVLAVAGLTSSFAVMWFCYGSRWMILGLTVVAAIFGFWIKSHFGPLFGMPRHAWSPMGIAEGAALGAMTLGAYWLAVVGFARARRGEAPLSLGVVAWLNSFLDRRVSGATRFASPLAAQRWYFQRNIWVAPAVVIGVSLTGIVIWGFASSDLKDLVSGLTLGCWGLVIAAGLGGMILGSLGSKGEVVLGQFLATRPLSTADMSRELLRTAAVSCVLAWVAWGILLAVSLGVVLVRGYPPTEMLPKEFTLNFIGAAIVASWGAMGCVTAIALVGRPQLVFRSILAISGVIVLYVLASKYALTPLAADRLYGLLVALVSMAVIGGTIWLLFSAERRELVSRQAVALAAVAWLMLAFWGSATIPLEPTSSSLQWLFAQAMVVALTALAVAPIAAAPMALASNRTR